jgi:hypothetical protein
MPLLRSLFLGVVFLAGGWAVHLSGPAYGQSPSNGSPSDELARHPGYVDLRAVESWFDTRATIQVDISGSLLSLVAQSTKESDAEFSQMIDELKAIQVRGYPMAGIDAQEITRRTDRLAQQLEREGWHRVLYVRDGSEVARIYVRPDETQIAGLTVLAVDPSDETVVVNVVGPMHPEELQRLGTRLDIESLRSVQAAQ